MPVTLWFTIWRHGRRSTIRKWRRQNGCSGYYLNLKRGVFTALWQEYEAGESADARFALVLDRCMPMLMNLHNGGQSWVENDISLQQVLDRNTMIADIHPELWHYLEQHLQDAQRKGWLK
ncbi:Uncharacterised protein [Serratia fonticola]|uniref:HD domain-containing protein n=1 Tax=Serratia fonticola TaxID=47917 RepID=A0A4V6KNS7_SERFO|nr:Uncharacterised protein [Serratia fonticola]